MRSRTHSETDDPGAQLSGHSEPVDEERRRYMRRYQNSWISHRRAIAADYLGGRCVKCGSDENLEFDHVDPKSKVSHRIWSWSQSRLIVELQKCQLLCRTCHVKKTSAERWRPITHGTVGGYRRGCHCHECNGANTESRRRALGRTKPRQECRCIECRTARKPAGVPLLHAGTVTRNRHSNDGAL